MRINPSPSLLLATLAISSSSSSLAAPTNDARERSALASMPSSQSMSFPDFSIGEEHMTRDVGRHDLDRRDLNSTLAPLMQLPIVGDIVPSAKKALSSIVQLVPLQAREDPSDGAVTDIGMDEGNNKEDGDESQTDSVDAVAVPILPVTPALPIQPPNTPDLSPVTGITNSTLSNVNVPLPAVPTPPLPATALDVDLAAPLPANVSTPSNSSASFASSVAAFAPISTGVLSGTVTPLDMTTTSNEAPASTSSDLGPVPSSMSVPVPPPMRRSKASMGWSYPGRRSPQPSSVMNNAPPLFSNMPVADISLSED